MPKVNLQAFRAEQEAAREEMARELHTVHAGKKQLKGLLCNSIRAVGSLFEMWDVNGDGQISKPEFQSAVAVLGVNAPPHVCDIVFDEFDPDGSGTVSYAEFLRFALRDALSRSSTRVMDFFKKFDADGSGEIGASEFREAVSSLGYDVPREHLDSIFATMDSDSSGSISFKELHKQLRQGASIKLNKSLRVGGAGKIRLKASERLNPSDTPPWRTPVDSPSPLHSPKRVRSPELLDPITGRPTTAPVGKKPVPQNLAAMLPPAARPETASAAIGQLMKQASVGAQIDASRPPNVFNLKVMGDSTNLAAPAHLSAVRGPRYPRPGGGGGPRPHNLCFVGYAARQMQITDCGRRRTRQDEKAEVAADRPKGFPLLFRKTLCPGAVPRWSQPLPAMTPDRFPLYTTSVLRSGPWRA